MWCLSSVLSLIIRYISSTEWVHMPGTVVLNWGQFCLRRHLAMTKDTFVCHNWLGACSAWGLPWWLSGKNPPAVQEMWVRSLFQEDPLEEGMAIHSSILAWRIPWKEEPAWLSSIRSQRVGRDWSDLACMQACSGWRPEMMLSVLWCTNRTSQQKNYLTQIVNSSEVENHWSRISMNLGIICPFVHVF